MFSTESRDRLLSAILGLVWAQWTELGVAGTRGAVASIIDPEALLLATTRFGRYDPRLFDEVLDWLARYSDRLDVTRLRRLDRSTGFGDSRVTAIAVEFMRTHASEQKWARTAEAITARETLAPYGAGALFRTPDGASLPTLGVPDEFFGSRGLVRPAMNLRGMAVPPDVHSPALSRLKLRTLVGQGVRAEVLLYLMTHDHAHGRLISARSGYSQKQVADYLALLATDGLVTSWDEGRTVQYRLAAPIGMRPAETSPYVDWITVFNLLGVVWPAVSDTATESVGYLASKRLREGLEAAAAIQPVEGVPLDHPEPTRHPGESLLVHAEEYSDGLVAALEGLSQ